MNTRSIHKHPGRGFIWDNYSNKEISSTVKKVWLWEVSGSWSGQLISQTETKQLYFLPGSITSQYMGPAYVLSQDEVLACTYHRATEQAEARFQIENSVWDRAAFVRQRRIDASKERMLPREPRLLKTATKQQQQQESFSKKWCKSFLSYDIFVKITL